MSEIDLGRLREVAEHEPGRDYWTLDDGDEALGAFRPSVILALLDRLERAEAAVGRVREVQGWYFDLDGEPGVDDTTPEPEDVWRFDRDLRAALSEEQR